MMHVNLEAIDGNPSSLMVCSLPMPPQDATVAVEGADAVQVVPLGQWPARAMMNERVTWPWPDAAAPKPVDNPPRRALVYARFPGGAPDRCTASLTPARGDAAPTGDVPMALSVRGGSEMYHHRDEQLYHYVKREDSVDITGLGRMLALRLGWRIGADLRWWQWVEIAPVWRGPLTSAYNIGGHLYAGAVDRMMTMAESRHAEQTDFYREATIAARGFVILHADGRIEMTVHFANTEAYGNGCAVEGLPVVELRADAAMTADQFAPAEGRVEPADDPRTWRWSFVDSPHIYLGHRINPDTQAIEAQYAEGSDTKWLPGVARSATCVINPSGRAATARRYLAAPSWYLRCAEFGVALGDYDANGPLAALSDTAANIFLRNIHRDGISRGGVYRYLDALDGRHELSGDGNEATQMFRGAYLRTHGNLYRAAADAARYIADVGIDHNHFNVHYHGDSPAWHTYSMIYLRFGGLVHLWQETGDPWYLELAEAVANRWIALNRVNHPRKNMGRDAEPVEGICQLYDATGKDHYFQAAEAIACDVARSLFEDGNWRSGHGVGPYWGINALDGTPWNGSHLLAGIAEFLIRACTETSPHYTSLLDAARRLVNKLLDKVDADCGGYHRATGSYLPRRHFLVADLARDDTLRARVIQAVERLGVEYEQHGEAFFRDGHHCAGYLDSPAAFEGVKRCDKLQPVQEREV